MGWIIKRVLQFLILLCILLVLAGVGVLLFVNPTSFKKEINQLLQTYSGYEIEINGAIDWSFSPQLSVHAKDITLIGPGGFKSPFISAKDAKVYIDAYSLLGDRLVITKLEVSDAVMSIERQASGSRNIDSLTPTKRDSSHSLTIKELVIKNGSILYQDELNARNWALNSAQISTKSVSLPPNGAMEAVQLSGDLVNLDNNLSVNINTTIKFDFAKYTASFAPLVLNWNGAKAQGTTEVLQFNSSPTVSGALQMDGTNISAIMNTINPDILAQGFNVDGKVQGEVAYTYTFANRTLEFTSFNLLIDQGTVKGTAKAILTPPYQATFDVSGDKLALQPIFGALKLAIPMIYQIPGLSSPRQILTNLQLNGKISGTELNLTPEFLINQATVEINAQDGLVKVGPVTLRAYESSHNLTATLDLTKELPEFKLSELANNVQLEPWLNFFNYPKTIVGIAEIKVNVTANGKTLASLKESAAGSVVMSIKSGSVFGLDIEKLLSYTNANINDIFNQLAASKNSDLNAIIKPIASGWNSTQKNNPASAFEKLDINSEIKQGISNTSFTMSNEGYTLKGKGNVSLIDKKVDLNMQITNKAIKPDLIPEMADYVKQSALPVTITGTMDQLQFNPDLQSYILNAIKQAQDFLFKRAAAKTVSMTGTSVKTAKSAEEIFVDSLKGLKE